MGVRTLYITEANTTLSKNGGRLVITSNSTKTVSVPIKEVEKVVLCEKSMVSKEIIYQMIRHEIPVIFLDWKRDCLSMLQNISKDVDLIIRQVELYKDPTYRLKMAKSIVETKIKNMRGLLRRIGRSFEDLKNEEVILKLKRAENKLERCSNVNEILGIEGAVASIYFSFYGQSFRDSRFKFRRRTKRPAEDVVNALLNFGYFLLLSEICIYLLASGLNCGIGFLHGVRDSRPSLALDVLEVFRQPLIDKLVLKLINKKILSIEDFEKDSRWGWRLKKEGLRLFLEQFENMMTNKIWLQSSQNESITPRIFIQRNVNSLKKAIIEKSIWEPELIKL